MKSRLSIVVAAVCGLTMFVSLRPTQAVEEYDRFLAGLRSRGYFDAAIFYLESMRNSPLLTDEQRMLVPFEEARTYLENSRSERDASLRDKLLDRAHDKFKEFADKNSAHDLAAGAITQLGAVSVERGRAKLEMGLSPQAGPAKPKLMEEARAYFDEAEKMFVESEKKFEERLKAYPKFMAPNDARVAERERAKGDMIQAHMFHAYCLYEKSRTYESGSDEWKKALQTAADKYGAIYKDYRTLIAGLAARLKEGQAYQEMKDIKRALGLYNDLLGQPDDLRALRPYKASAMYLSLQCWTTESEKMYALATQQGADFVKASSPDELQQPEWLAVRYFTAMAGKLRADQIPENAKGEEAVERTKSLEIARQNAEIVASTTGDYQDSARTLLKEISGSNSTSDRDPKSFLEAQNRGLDSMTAYSQAIADLPKATDEAARVAKDKEANEAREKAVGYFYQALAKADENTTLEDKNTVRYYLCYLAYTQNRTYDAAVIGEFLMRYYPNSGGARQAAQIALASYVTEYQSDLPGPGRDFDRAKMQHLATEIAKRWKGDKEADDAWNILLAIAVNEKRKDDMLTALENISPSSPIRAEAEMKVGRTLWSMYGEQLAMDDGAAGKFPPAEMQALTVTANKLLNDAIERQRPQIDSIAKLTIAQAEAEMFLCQSRIALGEFPKALECLEDPKMGLLTLVRNRDKNKEASADPIPIETYKLALQAYALNDKIGEAEKLLPELDALGGGGGSGDNKAQLANTYLDLALRLGKQIEQLRGANNIAALKKAAPGFTFFLKQIENNGDAFAADAKFQNLNWVSENFFRLGSDLLAADRADALKYFDESAALDDKIGPLTKDGSDAQLVVKLRKARAMRKAEKYVDSINALQEVLQLRRSLMEAQIEACETLMERAAKEPNIYTTAVNGSRPDPTTKENIIWGWKRIADTMRGSPPFNDPTDPSHKEFVRLFHLARYNMALCYYQQAMAQTVKEQRDQSLKAADYAITITQQYSQDMGGEEWKPKFEEMQKKIQNALK